MTALYDRWIAECGVSDPGLGVPNVGLFQAIGFRQFVPYLQKAKSWEDCLLDLERDTKRYVKYQRKYFRGKVLKECKRAGVQAVAVEMGDVDKGALGGAVKAWFEGGGEEGGGGPFTDVPGCTVLDLDGVDMRPPDKAVYECERCGTKSYGGAEWEAHRRSKMHKVRGSKKWRERREGREAWEARQKEASDGGEGRKKEVKGGNLTKTEVPPPPQPQPLPSAPPTGPKNSANKNKYATDADAPFLTSVLSFGQRLPITIHQTSSEATWPGGALWDPGVVASKLFCDVSLTPVRQSR